MVLESLMNPFRAEKKPWELIFIGIIYCSIAIFISLQVFKEIAALLSVFLTVMSVIPLMYGIIKFEEHKNHNLNVSERTLLQEHSRALLSITCLFIGIVISYVLWYVFLPSPVVGLLFSMQETTIQQINGNVVSGDMVNFGIFQKIFLNNIKVMIFALLFSFFYGAGAIFIITWNASVVAAAIGNMIRSGLSDVATAVGFSNVGVYFNIVSAGFLRYFIHGIPEMFGYFVAGLAGGIISVGIIRHEMQSKYFMKVMQDAAILTLFAVGILFFAAIIEVWITPLFF